MGAMAPYPARRASDVAPGLHQPTEVLMLGKSLKIQGENSFKTICIYIYIIIYTYTSI